MRRLLVALAAVLALAGCGSSTHSPAKRVARAPVEYGQRVKLGDPQLLGSTAEPTTLEEDFAERVAAWEYTAEKTGTVEELQFKVSANTQEATGIVLGIYANTGSGTTERPGAVLGQGTKSGEPAPSEVVKVTGLSIPVTEGTKYWLAFLPLGASKIHYNLNLAGTTHDRIIKGEHTATTIKEWPVESEWFGLSSFGPIYILANGTETGGVPSGSRKVVMIP